MGTFIGPGAGNYGWQDVYKSPNASSAWVQSVTERANAYVPPTSSGGQSPQAPAQTQQQQSSAPSQPDYSQQVRNDINSGYDQYFGQLDSMLGDLPNQKSTQEQIAQSQFSQAQNELGAQKTQGLADLNVQRRQNTENQSKTLQNLADDIRNQFRAGQVYLGSRGAGDSSAANQYAYAISKMGNQSRGNVLSQSTEISNQINDRETKLNNIYNSETNRIKSEVDQKVLSIAQWFQDAQNQIKQAKANGQLQKGQDLANLSRQLLQNATSQLMTIQQNAANQKSMLDQWAMNNSKTISDLKTNMATVGQYTSPGISNPGVNGQMSVDSQGNMAYNRTPSYGYGATTTDEKKNIWGATG